MTEDTYDIVTRRAREARKNWVETNFELYNEAVKKTAQISKLDKKEAKAKGFYFEMTEIIRLLVKEISKELEWEVRKASNAGKSSCSVYRYGDGAYFRGKPVAYLINGPHEEGLDHFKNRGIKDTMAILEERYKPFIITVEKNKDADGIFNFINVSWK